MKIGIICSSVVANGGSERAVSNMTRLFAEIPGVETKVVSLCSADGDSTCFEFAAPIVHAGLRPLQLSMVGKAKWYAGTYKVLRGIVKRHRFDVLLGIGHNVSILLPFVKHGRMMAYACEHIAYDTIPQSSRFLIQKIYPMLDGVIALSRGAAEKLAGLNSRIIVIPNSISFALPNNADAGEKKSIIMVGRLSAEKGYDRLIPIAAELKKRFPAWRIDVFGDGPMRGVIAEMLRKNSLTDYVNLHGQVSNIGEQYCESDLLMLTSPSEALPMAIIEANSQGLPAIGYENEGTKALIDDGRTGFIIPDGDVDGFIERLGLLIEDRRLREEMGQNALKKVEMFKPERVKQLWICLLKRPDIETENLSE